MKRMEYLRKQAVRTKIQDDSRADKRGVSPEHIRHPTNGRYEGGFRQGVSSVSLLLAVAFPSNLRAVLERILNLLAPFFKLNDPSEKRKFPMFRTNSIFSLANFPLEIYTYAPMA